MAKVAFNLKPIVNTASLDLRTKYISVIVRFLRRITNDLPRNINVCNVKRIHSSRDLHVSVIGIIWFTQWALHVR